MLWHLSAGNSCAAGACDSGRHPLHSTFCCGYLGSCTNGRCAPAQASSAFIYSARTVIHSLSHETESVGNIGHGISTCPWPVSMLGLLLASWASLLGDLGRLAKAMDRPWHGDSVKVLIGHACGNQEPLALQLMHVDPYQQRHRQQACQQQPTPAMMGLARTEAALPCTITSDTYTQMHCPS